MILKAYKYRINPTSEQAAQINKTIGVCRFLYNLALETKIYAHKSHGKNLSAYDLCYQLPGLKEDYPWINEIDSQAAQSAIKKVDIAFKNFFCGNGFPKYKSKRNGGSFQCPNNTRKVDFENCTLTIPKVKNIPIRISRMFEGKIKTITISKTSTAKYFASILVETPTELIKPAIPKKAIGIDLGIKDFAITSAGEKIQNKKYLKVSIDRIIVLQRRASKKKKGSNNRKRANRKVALLHEKVNNQRNDFLHKVSSRLIGDNQTDTICVETLAVKNMIKNHKLAQAISDVSWSEFIRQLEYKGKWYGKNVFKISMFSPSSKTCSNCGHVKDQLNLSERQWTCSKCNATHDRDINAANNIKNMGMTAVGSRKEPVEQRIKIRAKKQEYILAKAYI